MLGLGSTSLSEYLHHPTPCGSQCSSSDDSDACPLSIPPNSRVNSSRLQRCQSKSASQLTHESNQALESASEFLRRLRCYTRPDYYQFALTRSENVTKSNQLNYQVFERRRITRRLKTPVTASLHFLAENYQSEEINCKERARVRSSLQPIGISTMTERPLFVPSEEMQIPTRRSKPVPLISRFRGESPKRVMESMRQSSHEPRLSSSLNSAVFNDYKRPNYFIIHPNWLSESISIQKMGLEPRPPPIPTSKSLQNLVGKPPSHPNYRKQKSLFQKSSWPINCRCNGTQPASMSRPPTAAKRLPPKPNVERSKSVPSQQDNKRPETAPDMSLEKRDEESVMSNNSNEEEKDEAKVLGGDWQEKSNAEEAEQGTF